MHLVNPLTYFRLKLSKKEFFPLLLAKAYGRGQKKRTSHALEPHASHLPHQQPTPQHPFSSSNSNSSSSTFVSSSSLSSLYSYTYASSSYYAICSPSSYSMVCVSSRITGDFGQSINCDSLSVYPPTSVEATVEIDVQDGQLFFSTASPLPFELTAATATTTTIPIQHEMSSCQSFHLGSGERQEEEGNHNLLNCTKGKKLKSIPE